MKPEWDGFRLLVAVDDERRTRAWSRLGTSLGDRIGTLLDPLSDAPKRSIFDAELVALSSRDRSAIQDFGVVCRARAPGRRRGDQEAVLVLFDLLELAGDGLRSRPWIERTDLLREAFPVGDRLRLVNTWPASRAADDQLVALGFEGSVLKRPGSAYRPGRQPRAQG